MKPQRHKIMLVDDNLSNLAIGRSMLKDHYEVYPVPSGARLFEVLEHVTPALILLDVLMPGMDGFEVIRRLKASGRWEEVPVIFLTSRKDEGSELEGLSLGAIDYVAKPFSAPLLLQRIRNQLLLEAHRKELKRYSEDLEGIVKEKTAQVMDLQMTVISTLADMLEYRDDETGGHVLRTQRYLDIMVGKLLETGLYSEEMARLDLDFLVPSALLHDIGKIAISDSILRKPGPLDREEFEEMKKHSRLGADAIGRISDKTAEHAFLRHAQTIALTHHEKWDGSGYPDGLAGFDIPLEGRLMAVADVYDALVSDRPYKKAMSPGQARRIILEGRGKHFDPVLVDVFEMVCGELEQVVQEFAGIRGEAAGAPAEAIAHFAAGRPSARPAAAGLQAG
ncbi:MAG: response regulator [Deltaproteobacteria bacterium]|jgi:putative two-component system response regulator|nr:response regulator [Deltaproteobacteria bacterium]